MFFEIFKQGNLIIRGKRFIGDLEFDHELNLAPTTTMVLPADWLAVISGREEIKIHLDDGKVFWGIIWDYDTDKASETITLDIRHVVTEWQYRHISVNHAMSNKELNIVYKGDKVEKNEGNDETITANDFSIKLAEVGALTVAQLVAKASAQAWVTSTGDKVAITSADTSAFKAEEGTYNVIFSTAKGTSVTVECEVYATVSYESPESNSNKTNEETITATPFTVQLSENFNAEVAKQSVKAEAWVYKHKKNKVPIASLVTDFVNAVGEYTVTASTAKGTSISVKVTVEEDHEEDSGGDLEPSVVDKLEDIYHDTNFAYPGWQIDFQDDSASRVIDYVYSKQNKLDALTQTVELTDDLWWRAGFWNEKKIEIGKFGELKPYTISKKPSGKTNIRMIQEPQIDPQLENVANIATVYSDKSDGGMSSLTLREVYMNPSLQKDGFPVVILHSNVNNARDYKAYTDQYPKLAPNNELEYAIIDEVSVALESGLLIEDSYAFNDMSPFETDGKTIGDDKRIKIAQTAYHAVIKRLIQRRRSYDIVITTEQLPKDLLAGDKVRLIYDNKIWVQNACSNYWKKIMALNDEFYITHIGYHIDGYGAEYCDLTLTKWLRIERETVQNVG